MNMSVSDIDPDFPSDKWLEHWNKVKKEKVHTIETYHRQKDGTTYPVEVSVNYLEFQGKEYHCTFARDITERKEAKEALLGSEERFRTMFEEAPLGIALIDSLTGHIYNVNPRFAEIAGRTKDEMTSIDWMSITHPDDVQEDLDNMALLNAGEIPGFNIEKRYIHPDGSFIWINMTITPTTVKDKSKPRHLCMIEDITERKKAEEELKQSQVQLRDLANQL